MAVALTEKAANEVKRFIEIEKLDGDKVLRLGVVGGGCSGFQYSMGFVDLKDEAHGYNEKSDNKYEYHGVTVLVDKKSALYLDGTTVDYYHGLDKQGFTFDNPNAVKSCGCGSSFSA